MNQMSQKVVQTLNSYGNPKDCVSRVDVGIVYLKWYVARALSS